MILSLGGRSLKVEVGRVIKHDPQVRALLATMARSEVKNYLADLAEQTGRPFGSAEAFLTSVHVDAALASTVPDGPKRDAKGHFVKKGM